MTLPSAPSVAEPIVLFEEPEIRMPLPLLASAVALPFGMPMVLRRTDALLAEPLSTRPLPPLAATKFRRTVAPVEELLTSDSVRGVPQRSCAGRIHADEVADDLDVGAGVDLDAG